ncbi:MAG TPA: SDR family NAD(P)-dependent oxidoreductase, partial [Planctomycetaceae bacterium]|nr:SDR family NAD(P)-dependent oxidoreductase [Planctomycetaceae bacterium]
MPIGFSSPQPLSHLSATAREPLAVIGIGCRLPGGINSPTTFWEALLEGRNAICDVPEDRWNHSRFHDTNPEKFGCIRNAKGGFIKGVDLFDGEFFGYFPAEAQRIDPQQRLLLEVTHEAMEDAGLRRDQLEGSRTSVFIGAFMYDYLCMQSASEQRDEISPYVAMGTSSCAIANRVSYDFDLKGPSVTIDTACSGSLVAVHLACRSLWNGEADIAIAGGVNLMLRPESSIILSKGGFLNPDQYCKAFDASANGYVRGEGVGTVILKPLSKAIADGDAIYACVLGTGSNQDGYLPEGFTVPNVVSQIALLESVYVEAGIDPLKVDYVEAHGTGTSVGDPIESLAIGAVLGQNRPKGPPLLMGSVKTNIGHLEGAAGIAGFIKGVLTAYHRVVPPNLHFHEPNPGINWDYNNLDVPTVPTSLNSKDRPLNVGVNSFGAGGANAHVVIQGHALPKAVHHSANAADRTATIGTTLYVLSSPNRDTLRTIAMRHADFLQVTAGRLDDIAFSAFSRRSHYPLLLAVVGETKFEVADQLRKFADGQVDSTILSTKITRRKKPKLAFVFSGQGGQWARMGLQLMEREPIFRESIEEIDSLFHDLASWSLLEELRKSAAESKVNDTIVVQPAIMAVQIALVNLYEHYGIRPAGVVGHSIGEVAAAFVAGAITLEQAVQVIYHRSQAQNLASGKGGMLAVGLSFEDATKLIEGYDGRVSIGAVNGPEMLTLSGDKTPLEEIAKVLESRSVFNRTVKVQVAYHSHHMEPIKDIMLESLKDFHGEWTRIPLYSTVSGRLEHGTHLDAEYWFQNARKPVLFTKALAALLTDEFDTFVEIGPHPVLVGGSEALIQKRETDAAICASMTRKEPEVTVFLQSLARLAARGIYPDAQAIFGTGCRYVRLPQYPWQHHRHWFESPAAQELRLGPFEHPFLKRQTQMATEDGLAVWEAALSVQKFPYLRDHQVDGEIVFPATGHLELAWAVASQQFRHESFFLENLHFDSPLILPEDSRHGLEVRMEIVSGEGDYKICSRSVDRDGDASWSKHSSGRINTVHDRFEAANESLSNIREQFSTEHEIDVDSYYETIASGGLEYGERFRCIEQLWYQDHRILARLRLPNKLTHESQRCFVHPALLDACLHAVFAEVHCSGDPQRVFLPYRIDRVRIYRQPTENVWSYVRVTHSDAQLLILDSVIFDDGGELVAEFRGLTCKLLSEVGTNSSEESFEGCYEYRWIPAAFDAQIHGRIADYTTAVLISDGSGVADKLSARFASDGIEPLTIRRDDRGRLGELLADVSLDRRTLIVFATGLSHGDSQWHGLKECPAVPLLLELAQLFHRRQGVSRLFVVTNGAASTDSDISLDLGQSILHGMARVINNECPNVPIAVIDLSASMPMCEIDALYRDLLHSRRDRDESEIAFRNDNRFVRQLIPVERDSADNAAITDEPGVGGDYRADVSTYGALDQIVFRKLPATVLGDEEVEIAVHAAALNFKDVMNAMGLLPANAVTGGLTANRLGLEVAGRVLRTGPGVSHVREGDEVIARVAEGFCGRVITGSQYVFRKPKELTPIQAAAVPLVYVTAWYSLGHLARVERGETVLIHSAAGGVGVAAIQLALRAGATVIATAGTKEKRAWLKQIGVAHAFDSRSLDFYNHVMDVTGGRGVDIVLNSLTGRFITQSLKCLAPFGRFVELGKSDIYRNNKLGLERLGENISYFVVDVDRLALQKPKLHHRMLAEVVAMFDRGELAPHEITEFPISKLPEALRFMTRAVYQGKIVMNMENDRVQTLPPRTVSFRANRAYLISGGASGFGLEIAKWMAGRGARHLILLSRSGPKSDTDWAAIATMKSLGVEVILAEVDIADRDAVERLIGKIHRESPPLAGVVHGAAVLDDASIPTMDMERFLRVFNPKAEGAWNLHQATAAVGAELDFFLMLSSISSVLGLFGQVNYAAANYFQDSLAHYRRQRGLPGTSVNLGVLGDYAGMS